MIDFKNKIKTAKIRPIIFEGLDGSGKDYLRLGFSEATKHRYICVTRMFISSVVYADIYTRNVEHDTHWNMLNKFVNNFNPCVVYCDARDAVLAARIHKRGEPEVSAELRNITRSAYDRVFLEQIPARNMVRIDTTNNPSIEQMTNSILATLKVIDTMEEK